MNNRPKDIPEEKFKEWEKLVEAQEFYQVILPSLPEEFIPAYKETMIASCYLTEKLMPYNFSDDEKMKLDYTLGKLSFERNCWEVCEQILFFVENKLDASTIFSTTEENKKALN